MAETDTKSAVVDKASGALLAILASLAALGTLATNILLPSLPGIASSFDVPTAATGSLMSSFFATFALGQLFVGPLSDRYGRRPLVLAGLVIFVAGSIVCAVAATLSSLVIGRIIQAHRRVRILRPVAGHRPRPVLRQCARPGSLLHHGGDGGGTRLLASARQRSRSCVRLAILVCVRRGVRRCRGHLVCIRLLERRITPNAFR